MADPNNAPPSVDPSNNDNLGGTFNTILRKFLQSVDDMLPASVVAYDRNENRATLQPMVSLLTTAGAQVTRATVDSVPVLLLGGGGHMLGFNLKPGDMGWIKANDRDISMFLQTFGTGAPNTHFMHSFSAAMFIPDALRNFVIQDEDAENAVLQTLDGKHRIAIWADRVKITSNTATVEVKDTDINITAPTIVAVNSPAIALNGSVTSGGGAGTPNVTLNASNSITMNAPHIALNSADLKLNGKVWDTHHHTSAVGDGGSQTGGVA